MAIVEQFNSARPRVSEFVAEASDDEIQADVTGFIRQLPGRFNLSCYTDDDQRYGGNSSALPDQIVKLSFVITRTGRHVGLKLLHGKYFDSDVDQVSNEERHMFHEQIEGDERILPELYFNCHSLLHEIRLVI